MRLKAQFAHLNALIVIGTCVACGCDLESELGTGERSQNARLTSAADMTRRREEIRAYFNLQRESIGIVATTITKQGTLIDWAPARTDVTARPPSQRPKVPLEPGVVYATTVLDTEPNARGPVGTVAQVRPDFDALFEAWGDQLPEDPERLFDIVPTPNPNGNQRYYVERQAFAPATGYSGSYARINIWDVPQRAAADMTLLQVALSAGSGTGVDLDTIEAGKIQDAGYNGGLPTFFVYFTNSNYQQGVPGTQAWCPGGYVSAIPASRGWAGEPGASFVPGIQLTNLSVSGGTQVVMGLEWSKFGKYWWLYVNGLLVGRLLDLAIPAGPGQIPKFMFHPSSGPNTPGHTSGLASFAEDASWYGEVFDAASVCSGTSPSVTCTGATTTDMGSGKKANAGWAQAAFIDNLWVNESGIGGKNYLDPTVNKPLHYVQDANCYSGSGVSSATNGWYLGGGGTEETNCN